MQETRQSLYLWMTKVLQDYGWTAAEWARRAEVTPTNLTRFLKAPDVGSLPGTDTLARLARAAQSEPQFLTNGHGAGIWRVPLLSVAQLQTLLTLKRRQAEEFLGDLLRSAGDHVLIDRQASRRAFALQINSRHLNAGGVIEDDRIIIEPADVVPPTIGDLVIVVDEDSICAYRFYPPYLLPSSTDAKCKPVRHDVANVIGVGVHVIRPLRQ